MERHTPVKSGVVAPLEESQVALARVGTAVKPLLNDGQTERWN